MLEDNQPLWDDAQTSWLSFERRVGQPSPDAPGRFPDFLIVSPPRTGSTWLFENLRHHPGLFLPGKKELRYFDLHWREQPIDWYLSQFADAGARVSGEATPSYALLPSAVIDMIHGLNPGLKLIFLMREPVARAWSQAKHNHAYREANFAKSDSVPLERVEPKQFIENVLDDYALSAGDYEGALRRWRTYFPPAQFHLCFLEDVEASPEAQLRSIFGFLGVDTGVDLSSYPLDTKINTSAAADIPPDLRPILRTIYGPRTAHLRAFLKKEFAVTPPWPNVVDSQATPLWLRDRSDGWRIYLDHGEFQAVPITADDLASAPAREGAGRRRRAAGRHARFLHDLDLQLSTAGKPMTAAAIEDARLRQVLSDLAQSHRNYRDAFTPQRVAEHRGFDVVRWRDSFFGVRKTLGIVDFTIAPDEWSTRDAPEDIVRRSTLDGVMGGIEAIILRDALAQQVTGNAQSLYVQGQHIEVGRQALEALISRHDGEMQKAAGALTQLNARVDAVEQGVPAVAERVAALDSKLAAFERTLSAVQSSLQDTAAALQRQFQDGIDSQKAFLEQQHAATTAQITQMMKALEREQGILVRHRDGAALTLSQLRAEVATRVGEARETLADLQRQAGATQDAAQAQLDAFASRLALLHDAVERNASALEQLRAGSLRRIFAFLRPARE